MTAMELPTYALLKFLTSYGQVFKSGFTITRALSSRMTLSRFCARTGGITRVISELLIPKNLGHGFVLSNDDPGYGGDFNAGLVLQ